MFREIKENDSLKTLLNKIFLDSDEEIIQDINNLYIINEGRKNSLTGKSANALNTMLFAFNPTKYLSSVSLNDREKIIKFFEIPYGPDFEADFPGKKIFQSNIVIIRWFRNLLGDNLSTRTICDFLYTPFRQYWKSNIPDYQSIMLPLLNFAGDGNIHSIKEATNYISDFFDLTEKERKELQPSGYDRVINNRVGWSRFYLKKAGLLEDPKKGYLKITERGLDVLRENPPIINVQFLSKFSEFREFKSLKKEEPELEETTDEEEGISSPEDLLEEGYSILREDLAAEILERLRKNSPEFFEDAIVKLLIRMGYGEGERTGGPGDGGLDGIIYQDTLKIDKVCFQAKRYAEERVIGTNAIKNFIASMEVNRIDKGIFITTSNFTKEALEIVNMTNKKIILLNGKQIADLMIQYNLGVQSTGKIYEVKKIDSDYFDE